MSGVTARAIEDWLANATERGYQSAFCHLLNSMRYAVVHSTTHGPAEEGKDVIAKYARGRVFAFQLKRGNINTNQWRKMKSEIEELTEYAIRHPSINRRAKWQPILVTTGDINEYVSGKIENMNTTLEQRGFKKLITWSKTELLMKFVKHARGFIPTPITDFHRLLGMSIEDGKGLINKEKLDIILRSILPLGHNSKNKKPKLAIKSIKPAAVITEFALTGFDRAGNHFGKLEAYTMLTCYLWATTAHNKLKNEVWEPTVDLLEYAMDEHVKLLWEEYKSNDFRRYVSPLTEPIVGPYRNTMFYGLLASHGLWCMIGGQSSWFAENKEEIIKSMIEKINKLALPSEACVPAKFFISEFLRYNGHIVESDKLFKQLLRESVLRKIESKNIRPLWDPYMQVEEAILRDLGKPHDLFMPRTWGRNSYTGYSLILIAASRLMKSELKTLWHHITSLIFHEFRPVSKYKFLLWNNSKGTMIQRMVHRPTKWPDLRNKSTKKRDIPKLFKMRPHWLPYFLLVYPHRFYPDIVLALTQLISRQIVNRAQ